MARYSLDDLVQGLIQRGLSGEALARAIAISARENGMQGGDTGNLNKSEPANVAAMGPFQFVAGSHPDFNRQTAKDNLDYQLDYANRYFRSNDFSPWTVAPLPGGGYGFSQALANDFTDPNSAYRKAAQAAIDRVQSGKGQFTYYSGTAKAPTQNTAQSGSKSVATTQQDAQAQQQFGKNYDQLTPVQKYAVDQQGNIGTNGQPATLYSVNDVLKAGGKLSSTGNTYELKTGGKGSATIYFYPTTDASGKPSGMLQAPVIYANGSSQAVPYTGVMPGGLKPVQGGGITPPTQSGTPTQNGGGNATQGQTGGSPAGGGGSSIVPNASRSRGGNVDNYPSTTPTFSGVGGGAGAVLDALARTGGPTSFMPGGGPSPNNGGPYSLENPEEIGRLSGLLVGPGGLDAAYLRTLQDTGRDYFGYPGMGMVFGPNGWQFPNQFTQTQTQPPAGGGGAPGGDEIGRAHV